MGTGAVAPCTLLSKFSWLRFPRVLMAFSLVSSPRNARVKQHASLYTRWIIAQRALHYTVSRNAPFHDAITKVNGSTYLPVYYLLLFFIQTQQSSIVRTNSSCNATHYYRYIILHGALRRHNHRIAIHTSKKSWWQIVIRIVLHSWMMKRKFLVNNFPHVYSCL